ncbi:MAG: hypothetical protein WC613_02230 [Candidatus Aenigmatarchaeota archaeon]
MIAAIMSLMADISLTPVQLVWSLFAASVIVILFILYHMHLKTKKRRR